MRLAAALAGLLVLACLSPGLGQSRGAEEPSSQYFVEKTMFDDRVRFAFVAGLEGTGHHAIQRVFKAGDYGGLVVADDRLTELIYADGRGLPTGISVMGEEDHDPAARRRKGGKGPRAVQGPPPAGDKLRERKRRFEALLGEVAQTQGQGGAKRLVMLNALHSDGGAGMVSWPNFLGPHKSIHHVDLYDIARAAEAARVDLRILVLMRPAQSLLTSIVYHRGWSPGAYTAAYLADNAAVLSSQLRTIDRRFFLCAELNSLGEPDVWHHALIPFLHPQLSLDEILRTAATMRTRPKLQGAQKARYRHGVFGGEEVDAHGDWEFVRHLDRHLQQLNGTCRA